MNSKQKSTLHFIWDIYPLGDDPEESKHLRAGHAVENTSLPYEICYEYLKKLDEESYESRT